MAKKHTPRRKKKAAPRKPGPARAGRARPRKPGPAKLRKLERTRARLNLPPLSKTVRDEVTPAARTRPAMATCRAAREHVGLNQTDFAALLGKNVTTIESWETPNAKRRIEPPVFMAQLFGALLSAHGPNGWQLRHQVKNDGPVRALYALLRSAFEGHVTAPHLARRSADTDAREDMRRLVEQSNADVAAARAADPAGFAAVDAAAVRYRAGDINPRIGGR